tara:strand:+ start:545 stop:805 length:261 start_codon:yes stop_codon:yes gene_type:complete
MENEIKKLTNEELAQINSLVASENDAYAKLGICVSQLESLEQRKIDLLDNLKSLSKLKDAQQQTLSMKYKDLASINIDTGEIYTTK